MNKMTNTFQQEVSNTAQDMITRLYCEERGINYNDVMHQAHQAKLQEIMFQSQMHQQERMIKQHYQRNSGSLMSKIRDVLTVQDAGMPMPFMQASPYQASPMQGTAYQPQVTPQQAYQQFQGHSPFPVTLPASPQPPAPASPYGNASQYGNGYPSAYSPQAQAPQQYHAGAEHESFDHAPQVPHAPNQARPIIASEEEYAEFLEFQAQKHRS